jgi:hypothetical protein
MLIEMLISRPDHKGIIEHFNRKAIQRNFCQAKRWWYPDFYVYALHITILWIIDTKSTIMYRICNSQIVDQLQKFNGPDLSVDEDEGVGRPEMIFCQY